MKKTIYFLCSLFLSSMVFLSACNKDQATTNNTGIPAIYGHVHSYADGSGTTTFSYDSQGRLDSIVDVDFSGTTVITLAYSQNSVAVTGDGPAYTFTLNGQGLATSDSKGNAYTYDNNGYLISVVNGTNYSKYAISNGNVTTIVTPYSVTPDSIVNTFGTHADYRNYGIPFLGKNSTFKTVFSTYYGNGTSTKSAYLAVQSTDNHYGTSYWTYQYDSLGRVTSETQAQSGQNNGGNLYTYTN